MNTVEMVKFEIVWSVAKRRCGDDTVPQYLRKIARSLRDLEQGKPIRPWRLDRAIEFLTDVAQECLHRAGSPGCRTVML